MEAFVKFILNLIAILCMFSAIGGLFLDGWEIKISVFLGGVVLYGLFSALVIIIQYLSDIRDSLEK